MERKERREGRRGEGRGGEGNEGRGEGMGGDVKEWDRHCARTKHEVDRMIPFRRYRHSKFSQFSQIRRCYWKEGYIVY